MFIKSIYNRFSNIRNPPVADSSLIKANFGGKERTIQKLPKPIESIKRIFNRFFHKNEPVKENGLLSKALKESSIIRLNSEKNSFKSSIGEKIIFSNENKKKRVVIRENDPAKMDENLSYNEISYMNFDNIFAPDLDFENLGEALNRREALGKNLSEEKRNELFENTLKFCFIDLLDKNVLKEDYNSLNRKKYNTLLNLLPRETLEKYAKIELHDDKSCLDFFYKN